MLRYGDLLARTDAVPSIGTVEDSYDALAETVDCYYKAKLTRGPARGRSGWD